MTIKKYLENVREIAKTLTPQNGAPAYDEMMISSVCIWSNDACKGYCIDAMQRAGMSREQIQDVLNQLRGSFDEMTEDEAERVYKTF